MIAVVILSVAAVCFGAGWWFRGALAAEEMRDYDRRTLGALRRIGGER